jgi:hypothetical protein
LRLDKSFFFFTYRLFTFLLYSTIFFPLTIAKGNKELVTGCCARDVLPKEPGFQAQRGQLAEELEALNQRVIFYLKFHYELNFIERFWCSAKFYPRENWLFSLGVTEEALHFIPSAMINRHYM